MFKRSKAGNGRIGHAGAGMETWKLAAIVAVCIGLAVVGGIFLEMLPHDAAQAEVDLGFEAPAGNTAATPQHS